MVQNCVNAASTDFGSYNLKRSRDAADVVGKWVDALCLTFSASSKYVERFFALVNLRRFTVPFNIIWIRSVRCNQVQWSSSRKCFHWTVIPIRAHRPKPFRSIRRHCTKRTRISPPRRPLVTNPLFLIHRNPIVRSSRVWNVWLIFPRRRNRPIIRCPWTIHWMISAPNRRCSWSKQRRTHLHQEWLTVQLIIDAIRWHVSIFDGNRRDEL